MAAEPVPTATPPVAGRAGALRRRLARALFGLTVSATAALGLAYWATESWVERASLGSVLADDLDRRLAESAPSAPGRPGDAIRYLRGEAAAAALGPALASLAPGGYPEVMLQGHVYRVLVRDVAAGERAYLLNDIGPLAERENELLWLLLAGAALVGLVAWFASGRLARLALAPLERLAAAIRSLDPARRDARLALEQDEELRGIGLSFNRHLEALARLTERELAFAAAVSHELRTHLAVIENTTELMTAQAASPSPELRRVARAAQRARDDLDALLAMARPQPVQTGEVDLERLLRQVADDVAATVPQMPALHWCVPGGAAAVPVTASAKTLAIVFANLLRNAVLAGGADGRIEIGVDAGGFSIVDDGPGLPEGDWALLFEPWFEGRNGGSGLGMFVAHTLATRLGDRLELSPVQPHGLAARYRFGRLG